MAELLETEGIPDNSESFSFPTLPAINPLIAKSTVRRANESRPQPMSTIEPVLPRRRRFLYEKGYSQMDWVRLMKNKQANLNGLNGGDLRNDITMAEVAQHSSIEDAWTVIRGRVYNLTPYLKFYPGGEDMLLKIAGREGTSLFDKYHAWVNVEFLLSACLIGTLT